MKDKRDRIMLQGLVFYGHTGVLDFEKKNGQPFEVDAVLLCQRLPACKSDRLDQTIDYGEAYAIIRQIVEAADCNLIENLAEQIAMSLLDRFPLAETVDISVRKPQAPIEGKFTSMGIRIFRGRSC
jgi:dihydroneopterin aldolase